MSDGSVSRFVAWLRGYFEENWGAPFVLGFIVLLVVAAVCLVAGLEWWAGEVANFAYFLLVVGVVLQLVCFWKFGERGGEG